MRGARGGETAALIVAGGQRLCCPFGQKRAQRYVIGLGIGILLLQKVQSLLDHDADRRKAPALDERLREGMLVVAQRDGTLDGYGLLRSSALTR